MGYHDQNHPLTDPAKAAEVRLYLRRLWNDPRYPVRANPTAFARLLGATLQNMKLVIRGKGWVFPTNHDTWMPIIRNMIKGHYRIVHVTKTRRDFAWVEHPEERHPDPECRFAVDFRGPHLRIISAAEPARAIPQPGSLFARSRRNGGRLEGI